jgi:hypothetical protein
VTTVNLPTDFGWEYVWHCHLLGHEENDMMRPLVFKVAVPAAATSLTATVLGDFAPQTVRLNWSYTQGAVPATTFLLQKSTSGGPWTTVAAAVAVTGASTLGTVSNYVFTDTAPAAGTTIVYRVSAAAGPALSAPVLSNSVTLAVALAAPTNLVISSVTATQVILTWTAPVPATGVTGYTMQRAPNVPVGGVPTPGTFVNVGTSGATNFRNTGLTTKTTYFYRVQATGAGGQASAYSIVRTVTTP